MTGEDLARQSRPYMELYTIKDVKLGFPVPPDTFASDEIACRAFDDFCEKNKGRIIADLEFWYLGRLYQDTGELVGNPRFLKASNLSARVAPDLAQKKEAAQ